MSNRILVMAGGTGGHVFPGLAVAKHLQAEGWKILWLGTQKRMEADLVPKNGFDISFIDIAGVRGNGLVRKLLAPIQIMKSILQARKIIKSFQPDVVLGMGGFASGPGGIAAWLSGTPLVLHEQNAIPGMTNKILSRFATKVLTGFDQTFPDQSSHSSKFQWVGNPVRDAFAQSTSKTHVNSPVNILVVGGSLGAKALNESVPGVLQQLENTAVHHQCGAGHLNDVTERYRRLANEHFTWQVDEFVDDMPSAYQWADLVICRAGALTVAEVAAIGVPAIFVPLPHAVDDHQTVNARALENLGAAVVLPQNELEKGGLVTVLKKILSAPNDLLEMGRQAKKFARLDATQSVASVCAQLAEGSR